jgi:hypothetical protein
MNAMTEVTDLISGEKKNVCARRVHLVTLTRMNSLLLYSLDLQGFKLLIEDLTLDGSRISEKDRHKTDTLTKSITTLS